MAPTKRRFCQHCQEYVSIRTFRVHYDLYFNKRKNEWEKVESSDEENGLQTDGDLNNISLNTTTEESDGCSIGDQDQNETRLQPGIWYIFLSVVWMIIMR